MTFRYLTALSLAIQQKFRFFLLQLLFIMPQATCLAQEGCFVNEFELLTLGTVVLQDMIVFLFNMIPTNQVSMGCTSRDYAIFFHSSQQDPLSMCIGLLVFNYR